MKIHRILALGLVVAALAASRCMAQTVITNSYTNSFATGGNTTFFTGGSVASYFYWYGLNFNNNAMTNDPTMDASGDTNESGSLYCALPMVIYNQVQIQGTFDNQYGYDDTVVMPLSVITQLSFDIHVQSNTVPNSSGNFGQILMSLIDPGNSNGGRDGAFTPITIPGSATNGWYHMVDTTTVADILTMEEQGFTTAAGFGLYYNSYGGYPTNEITFWIDNIAATTAATPPPPPPPPTLSIAPAVQGLNLFAGSGKGLNNRESLETIGNDYSWVGASGPVSYSFTIKSYPIATNAQFQNHIFLDPNPGTGSAPDYGDPNVIFMDLESTAAGTTSWMFRYKTNEPQGNTMVYGSGTLATINSSNVLGTYTVTFNDDTNVTMAVPDGTSTNFSIPDSTGATTAIFASGVVLYYGVQANNSNAVGDHIVASDFNVTGLGSADFDDNFVTDAGTLNTAIWEVNAQFPACVQLVGPADPYFVSWTTPAIGYSLQSTPSLSSPAWTPTTSMTAFVAGTNDIQLISTNDLPAGNSAFFSVVQRTNTQLLILLPGETNAPNTATGKTGTPTSYSLNANGGIVTVIATVLAVDPHFYPVAGITDTINITDNDGGIDPNNANLVNGTGQYTVYFEGTGTNVTITATDVTTATVTPATSSPFNINP